ncbi:MAG: DEAD/DEAH box helicase [Candidatus Dadabacteria bacterium]|nr:DEAD/DEAH box helicase [Candidatus Dadabacteria bacterium]
MKKSNVKKLVPRKYQTRGVNFLKKHGGGALFLKPGAGKTAIVLLFLKWWFKNNPGKKVLLIGPLKVIYDAWEYEPEIWYKDLKVCNIHKDGFIDGFQLYTINPARFVIDVKKNLQYVRQFEGLIVDESTMFKENRSARTQMFHRYIDVIPLSLGIILTGTPITRNLLDLYGQYYLIDKAVLGSNFYIYRSHFFEPTPDGSAWIAKEGSEDDIVRRLSYKSFILSEKEEDDIGYPKILVNDMYFTFSPKVWKKYKKLHDDFVIELEDREIDRTHHKGKIYSGAVMYGYCTQFTSGNMYEPILKSIPDPKDPEKTKFKKIGVKVNHIHDERIEVLKNLTDVLNGEPIFILYHYDSDLILFKKLKIKGTKIIRGGMKPKEVQDIIKQWNTGSIPAIFAQIKTVSHGLNLQFGGSHICYYNLPDDYDLYYQSLHRLVRPGQKKKQVTIHRIICRHTVDELKRLQILNRKIFTAADFKKRLQSLVA